MLLLSFLDMFGLSDRLVTFMHRNRRRRLTWNIIFALSFIAALSLLVYVAPIVFSLDETPTPFFDFLRSTFAAMCLFVVYQIITIAITYLDGRQITRNWNNEWRSSAYGDHQNVSEESGRMHN